MAFGLTNAPATIQRLMEQCLRDLNFWKCGVYLYDVIVFAKDFNEMLKRLEEVLNQFSQFGLKLKPFKCKLFQTHVYCLGHIVSANGIETDPDKISSLLEWQVRPPQNTKELQTFLGFAGYYRLFILTSQRLLNPSTDCLEAKRRWERKTNQYFKHVTGHSIANQPLRSRLQN